MELLIFWILCGVVAGIIASSKGGSGGLGCLVGALFGPLGIIIAFFMGNPAQAENQQLQAGQAKKCPRCAELVKPDALVCKHCSHEFASAA